MTADDGGRRRRADGRWAERAKARDGVRWAQTDDVCERGRPSGGGRWGMLDAHGARTADATRPQRFSQTAVPPARYAQTGCVLNDSSSSARYAAVQLFLMGRSPTRLMQPVGHTKAAPLLTRRVSRALALALGEALISFLRTAKTPLSHPDSSSTPCYR